jgi:hypothetical protein
MQGNTNWKHYLLLLETLYTVEADLSPKAKIFNTSALMGPQGDDEHHEETQVHTI